MKKFIGKKLEVLVEHRRPKDGLLEGFSENYIRCAFSGPDTLKGRIVTFIPEISVGQKLSGHIF